MHRQLSGCLQIGGRGVYLRNAVTTHVTLPELKGCVSVNHLVVASPVVIHVSSSDKGACVALQRTQIAVRRETMFAAAGSSRCDDCTQLAQCLLGMN
jgi:hypothetical protein